MLFPTVSHPDFQLLSQTAHVCFRRRKRVHTRLSEKDRTQRLTRRNTGLSLPRPQCGFVLPAKSLLFHRAFIYIHFPVLCEPSPSADGENLAKLPSQTLSQTVSHPDFQLLPQMAHGRFCRRKRVHTRLCSKDRTQGLTRRNTGISDGGGITTLGAFHTFRKPCVARG